MFYFLLEIKLTSRDNSDSFIVLLTQLLIIHIYHIDNHEVSVHLWLFTCVVSVLIGLLSACFLCSGVFDVLQLVTSVIVQESESWHFNLDESFLSFQMQYSNRPSL